MSLSKQSSDLFNAVFDLIDSVVELYLSSVIKPFLKLHETFYSGLNAILRKLLDDHYVPEWFTANFITYFRTALVIPTLLLLAAGHGVVAAVVCLAVDFGDFLDGVVARYWVDVRASQEEKPRSASPANSDEDSFGTT